MRYLSQRFEPRALPELIVIDDHDIIGPFCVHCGNPRFMHGPDSRCPNQHLHPLFPPPNLSFEDEAGISREARDELRRLRGKRKSVIAASVPDGILAELLGQGYVRQQDAWIHVA